MPSSLQRLQPRRNQVVRFSTLTRLLQAILHSACVFSWDPEWRRRTQLPAEAADVSRVCPGRVTTTESVSQVQIKAK